MSWVAASWLKFVFASPGSWAPAATPYVRIKVLEVSQRGSRVLDYDLVHPFLALSQPGRKSLLISDLHCAAGGGASVIDQFICPAQGFWIANIL